MEVQGVKRLTPAMRREQTRTYLLDAAATVFAARGFNAASLDEIAEAAGFTKGAVYSNFAGKEELFLALVKQRQDSMLEQFFSAAAEHDDPAGRIAAISDVYRRLTPTTVEWALWEEFLLYALRTPEVRAKLDADLEAAFAAVVELVARDCAEQAITPPIAIPALARLYLAVFDGLARQRAFDPHAVPDELFATLVTFINDALIALGTKPSQPAPPKQRQSPRRSRR